MTVTTSSRAVTLATAVAAAMLASPHALAGAATAPAQPATATARVVQQRLVTLRYLPDTAITGVWDDRTAQAVMAFQGWEGLARDGQVGPRTLAALATAQPPRPVRMPAGPSVTRTRSIEVFRARGVTLLVERGQLVRAIHSSSGKAGFTTPSGSFRVFRRELRSWSVPYRVWLPYAAYFNGGIAFHASTEVPGDPASHGCIRVPIADAAEVFAFAQIGTVVTVY